MGIVGKYIVLFPTWKSQYEPIWRFSPSSSLQSSNKLTPASAPHTPATDKSTAINYYATKTIRRGCRRWHDISKFRLRLPRRWVTYRPWTFSIYVRVECGCLSCDYELWGTGVCVCVVYKVCPSCLLCIYFRMSTLHWDFGFHRFIYYAAYSYFISLCLSLFVWCLTTINTYNIGHCTSGRSSEHYYRRCILWTTRNWPSHG